MNDGPLGIVTPATKSKVRGNKNGGQTESDVVVVELQMKTMNNDIIGQIFENSVRWAKTILVRLDVGQTTISTVVGRKPSEIVH